jgi:hypothetical protein
VAPVDPIGDRRSGPSSPKWWQAYQSRLSTGYLELITAEAGASQVTYFNPLVVPGLLQTREYAEAITRATTLYPITDDDVQVHVDVRMRRQDNLLDASNAVQAVFVLEETSMRRPVGSRQTMHRQLDHLLSMMDHPAVTLFVIPFSSSVHPGIAGPFMLVRYPDVQLNDVLCFEGHQGSAVVRDRPDLAAAYEGLVDDLKAMGMSHDEAVRLIRSVREDARGR